MAALGQILLADDEETFLLATGDLLRREGYACECVSNAEAARVQLQAQCYDVLISDIQVPGNTNLELLQELPRIAEGMSVLLVTGHPSQHSAIEAIRLPVVAYLLKPIEFSELQAQVTIAVQRTRLYRTVTAVRGGMQTCQEHLEPLEQWLAIAGGEPSGVLAGFLNLTFEHITGALADVKSLAASLGGEQGQRAVCHLLDCPRLEELKAVLEETAAVLHKTKRSFKSKELGMMRAKLEEVVRQSEQNLTSK